MKQTEFPAGVYPAMTTPLNEDFSIHWEGVAALVEWYIKAGVAGLFAVGQSGEMFRLTNEERLQLAQYVVKQADGRVPVLATGTFGGPISEQSAFIRQMANTGVQAVTVIASEMAEPDESDDIWKARVEQLMSETGAIPLALYECPEPYHRLIAPELVAWAGGTGRFHLLKETSRSLDAVLQKVKAADGTPLGVYNADASTLLASLRGGAKGYCGIAANFYPRLVSWLCDHFNDEAQAAENVQTLMGIADPQIHNKYPVCAKYYQKQAGFDFLTISRVSDAVLNNYDKRVMDYISKQMNWQIANLPA